MSLSRRHVLALLAASAASSCTADGALPDPIAAWRDPGAGETDPRRYALAHAILAPNPHNRQPWLVDLVSDNELRLFVDLDRLLPETDPFNRQITVGCGAFLELFRIAALQQGHIAEITVFPDGEPHPRLDARAVAHVKLTANPTAARDPLFGAITARRTNRKAYTPEPPPEAMLAALAQAAAAPGLTIQYVASGDTLARLRALAWNAFNLESHTPHAHGETARLLRVGQTAIAMERDGIAVEGPVVEIAQRLGVVTPEVLANPDHPFTKPSIDAWKPLAEAAPGFIWIRSADNTRAAQIAAGMSYARLNLAATAQGLAMHPWSQALQEYPEMATYFAEVETATGAANGARTQMLARIGHGPEIPPSPRRGIEANVRRA